MGIWDFFAHLETGLSLADLAQRGIMYAYPDHILIQRGRDFEYFVKKNGLWYLQPVRRVWYTRAIKGGYDERDDESGEVWS